MDRTALHPEIRNALQLADELSRHGHALGKDALAAHLSSLRSVLAELEREVGQAYDRGWDVHFESADALHRTLAAIRERQQEIPGRLRGRLRALLASADRVAFAMVHPRIEAPSKPVLGALPLARVVPQDAHSVLDWTASALTLASTFVARTTAGRVVGANLGMLGFASANLTDHRLGVVRVVPIEAHETFDYAWGAAAALSPFVFGYVRKDPVASALQIASGVCILAASLLTDYRARLGRVLPQRSRGGPPRSRARGPHADAMTVKPEVVRGSRRRVPEVQRPLEGLSSAGTDWAPVDGRRTTFQPD